jgi:hypothetical protein
MLRDDVVILDSPGLDYDGSFDEWIDKTTRDAGINGCVYLSWLVVTVAVDVFILVVNAVSTLSGTESRFFHTVK